MDAPVVSSSPTPRRVPRVSVLVASHLGRERIERTLDSLDRQTLDRDRYEVVVVVNGPDDGTVEVVRRRQAEQGGCRVRLVATPYAGLSNARNLAVHAAAFEYVTWVDDDDWVSESYLKSLLEQAAPDAVVLAYFADVAEGDPDAPPNFDNYLNREIGQHSGQMVPFSRLPTAASANSGKLVPTAMLRQERYDPDLGSGEDVVLWSTIFCRHQPMIRVVPVDKHCVYYRTLRAGSVSRKHDRRFLVDRVAVIARLERLIAAHPQHASGVGVVVGGQAMHCGRYLAANPADRAWALQAIRESGVRSFPFATMNAECADLLVIAYAFPPVNDTSALVTARRLHAWGEAFDVLTHAMAPLRFDDPDTVLLVEQGLARRFVVAGHPVSAHIPSIANFCAVGLKQVTARESSHGPYRKMYSRAMWPAAHVAGALYKARNPGVSWVAEFSDPLVIDVRGQVRIAPLGSNPLIAEIEKAIAARGLPVVATDNVYEWIENITFALADEILFTNAHQLEFMLDHTTRPELAARVRRIATVSPHPTLPQAFYTARVTGYSLPQDRINLGYFGVFYKTREVGALVDALALLDHEDRQRVMLHIFTDKPEDVAVEVGERGLLDCVRVAPYQPYLEFLNLTTRFDWLVVADAQVADSHGTNPYLPSKLSDYRGSGARIWALVEPGSSMSAEPVDHRTVVGDVASAAAFLGAQSRAAATSS